MKYLDRAFLGLAYLGGTLIAIVAITTTADVTLRYLFNHPLGWASDLGGYLLLYSTFLGAVWVLRQDSNVRVDILLGVLETRQPRLHRGLLVLGDLVSLAALLVVTWLSIGQTMDAFERQITTIGALVVPRFWLMAAIPFGCALLSLQTVRNLVWRLQGEGRVTARSGELDTPGGL